MPRATPGSRTPCSRRPASRSTGRVRTSHLADVEALFGSRFTDDERTTLSALLLQLLEPGEDETPACVTELE